jgi:hypothetical protein
MPKYKNGKVVSSRFKAQGFIRSKCHLNFHRKLSLQGGTLRNLLHHRIFSKFEGKIFSSSENLNNRCEENEVLNS